MDIDYYLIAATRRAHRLRPGRQYMIGRESGADIHLQDAMISRRHAELYYQTDQGWILRDLGSRNGSTVSGQRVEGERLLEDQDRIQFGGNVYDFHMVPPGSDLGSLSNHAPQIDQDVTMGPGVSAASLLNAGAAFSGTIGDGGVPDLLQFLLLTRKTGRLDVLAGTIAVGWIHVAQGAVRAAGYGAQRGFQALLDLARAGGSDFAFHNDASVPPDAQITMPAEAVLMELARQLDEG